MPSENATEAELQEYWRRFDQAIEDAVEEPHMLHCPVCFHEYTPPDEGELETGGTGAEGEGKVVYVLDPNRPVYCHACIINGVVTVMGMVEDFETGPWYAQYLIRKPPWELSYDLLSIFPAPAESEL